MIYRHRRDITQTVSLSFPVKFYYFTVKLTLRSAAVTVDPLPALNIRVRFPAVPMVCATVQVRTLPLTLLLLLFAVQVVTRLPLSAYSAR